MARNRDVILGEFKRAFAEAGVKQSQICRKTGICPSTIHNWRVGKTRSPLISTMRTALDALGYKITVIKR